MVLLPMLLACTTEELSASWQIDRLRVLAIAAEPAEPRPGDVVSFRSLTVAPADPGWGLSVWVACLDGDQDAGCAIDPELVEGVFEDGEVDPDEQQLLVDAGLIGVEPFLAPTWTVPTDALAGLEEDARLEGVTAFVNVSAFPGGDSIDTADVELAYKRLPVSEATTPNGNPSLLGVAIDGYLLEDGATITLDVDQTYDLEPVLAEGAVETYRYVRTDGTVEERLEEPYVSLYTEAGAFNQTSALWPELARTYTTPSAPEASSNRIWTVVRDRRGGMAWHTLNVEWR